MRQPTEEEFRWYFNQAQHWFGTTEGWFNDTKRVAILAVTEYLLNQKGMTSNPILLVKQEKEKT